MATANETLYDELTSDCLDNIFELLRNGRVFVCNTYAKRLLPNTNIWIVRFVIRILRVSELSLLQKQILGLSLYPVVNTIRHILHEGHRCGMKKSSFKKTTDSALFVLLKLCMQLEEIPSFKIQSFFADKVHSKKDVLSLIQNKV